MGEEMSILDDHRDIPDQTGQFAEKKKIIQVLNSAISGRINGSQGCIRSSTTVTSTAKLPCFIHGSIAPILVCSSSASRPGLRIEGKYPSVVQHLIDLVVELSHGRDLLCGGC